MKVLFVGTGVMGSDGSILYWEPIISALSRKIGGLSLFISNNLAGEKLDFNVIPPFKLFKIGNRTVWLRGFFKGIKKFKPDVIVISEFGIVTVISLAYKFFFRKVRLVLLVENHPRFLVGYGANREGLFTHFRSFVARTCDVVVANNSLVEEYLLGCLGVEISKIIQGPYLTSVRVINREREIDKGNKLLYVAVGQLISRKGFDVFINEISALNMKYPGNFCVFIAGEGPCKDQLNELICQLNLKDAVKLLGRIDYSEMGELLAKADVFVMPTRADYRSLVMFEAISAGLPVVASCYDGAAIECVREGENGFICDPLISGEISHAMGWFIENKPMLKAFSEKSLIISKAFTVDIAANTICKAVDHAWSQ